MGLRGPVRKATAGKPRGDAHDVARREPGVSSRQCKPPSHRLLPPGPGSPSGSSFVELDWQMLKLCSATALLVASSLLLGGCAHGSAETPLLLELERSRTQAAEERARVAELEARLVRVEARPRSDTNSWRIADKLDRLIALQRQVLQRIEHERDATGTRDPIDDDGSFEEQLGRLMERLRSDPPPWHGFSREKREALRVLMRQDRTLDTDNPLQP